MRTELLLMKDGSRLAPCDPISAEIVEGLERGKQYRALLNNPRNPRHHRLVMAFLSLC